MSRARRLPRHRKPSRVVAIAAPVAVGGAVAAVAVTASPLADSLRPGHHASAGGSGHSTVLVEPASSASPDRPAATRASRGALRSNPAQAGGAAPGPVASASAVASGDAGTAARTAPRPASPGSVTATTPAATPASTDSASQSPSASSGPSLPVPLPTVAATKVPLPVPTPSPSVSLR